MTKRKNPTPEVPKRIPVGTEVSWYGRYPDDPVQVGTIIGIIEKGEKFPEGRTNCGGSCYLIRVEITATGRKHKRPVVMRPYVVRVNEQNPNKAK